MTRINSSTNPKYLTDQHLLAELRELPRIFTAVSKRINKGQSFNDIPEKFTLGTGHMKFFYNKIQFLLNRHKSLRYEYRFRFNKQYNFDDSRFTFNYFNSKLGIGDRVWFNYMPTNEEHQLLVDRITTRIIESKQIPRYYGKPITKEQAVNMIKSSNSISI